MGFYKKTVLLSNQGNYGYGMAILTIEQNNGGVYGSVKAFDMSTSENLVLGISVNDKQIFKQKVNFSSSNVFNFKLDNSFNINGKIGSVLVKISEGVVTPLLWGTSGLPAQYKNDILTDIEKDYERPEIKSFKEEIKITKAEEIKPKVKEIIPNQQNEEIKPELFETSDEEIEEIIDNELEGGEFYNLIHEQIDELFEKFPEEENISKIIPNSKWIKVNYDDNGKEFILGLIYEKQKIKYICYGVPSIADNLPPKELETYSQWLPIDEENLFGYWVMFQDADTGDNVVIDSEKQI